MTYMKLLNLLVFSLFTTVASAEESSVDLLAERNKVLTLSDYSGSPNAKGVLGERILKLPAFKRAVYYRGYWWPYGGNRVQPNIIDKAEGEEGGIFLLLELKDGGYMAVLPLCGDLAYAWLAPHDENFYLKFGTHGHAEVKGDLPLLSSAHAASAYEAIHKAWKQASETKQIKGWMKLREQKEYPEMFQYLGWCSWESYHKKISADKMLREFEGLEASKAPVRYLLVDDGHFNTSSLKPKATTFPQGYKALTQKRNDKGIKWIGMWYALLGDAWGVPAAQPDVIKEWMMTGPNQRSFPKPDPQSIEKFLNYMMEPSVRDGVDFVKVDFCGSLLPFYAGTADRVPLKGFPPTNANAIANPSQATAIFARKYQQAVAKKFKGLMNCNWHTPHFIFNSGDSVVGRCSEDYKLGYDYAKKHLYHSYSSMPWLGQLAWGDHDMFHSSDDLAGGMMALSKAISGGPVYLSDKSSQLVPERIMPMCYEDGLLPRPLAPAAPLAEDLFHGLAENRLYRVMAPLPNKSVSVVLYNFSSGKTKQLSGTLSPQDYQEASGLIQPYEGNWPIPQEGLVIYDYAAQKAEKFSATHEVSIKGFGDHLLQVSPIKDGWSMIGRSDKYLSAATFEVLSQDKQELKIRLKEAGPFAVWCSDGSPKSPGLTFTARGKNLFICNLPVKAESLEITLTK